MSTGMRRENCFWAGVGTEQPDCRKLFLGYEPCDEIRAAWSGRIAVIEVVQKETFTGQPPLSDDCYPTGRWLAVSKESQFLKDTDSGPDIIAAGKMLVTPVLFEDLLANSLVIEDDPNPGS